MEASRFCIRTRKLIRARGTILNYMYPYILVCHLKTKTLCRHFMFDPIPRGFVKVIWFRDRHLHKFRHYPNDANGQLKPKYWSAPRDTDIQFHEMVLKDFENI